MKDQKAFLIKLGKKLKIVLKMEDKEQDEFYETEIKSI